MTGNKRNTDRRQQELPVHKTNNEKFNDLLNGCRQPRQVYEMLASLKPSVEQTDQMCEKRKVVIRELLSGLDIS